MNKFFQTLAHLGLIVVAFLFRLVVIVKVWTLVAVPLGAPQLDQLHAYGIMLIATLATENKQDRTASTSDTPAVLSHVVTSVVGSLVAWGVAYWLFG